LVKKKKPNLGAVVFSRPRSYWLQYYCTLPCADLDWASFWGTITRGQYEILLLISHWRRSNYFIRAVRWSFAGSNTEKKVPLLLHFLGQHGGLPRNAYLPARAGELIRSAYWDKKAGRAPVSYFATALVERLLDVIALVLIAPWQSCCRVRSRPCWQGRSR